MPPAAALLASSLLFPSFQYQETGIEGFGVQGVEPGANAPFKFENPDFGFGIQTRAVIADPSGQARGGSTGRLRFRFEDGIKWEDVMFSPGFFVLLARPDFGTIFELGIGPFQNDLVVYSQDNGTLQSRLFVPITLNPVSFANTDQDADKKLKYTFRAGAGVGADITAGIGKTLLLSIRLQGDYRYTWRDGAESLSHKRGDTELALDAGIGFRTSGNTAILASFFWQDRRQWTYDGPIDGVGRGNQVIGARVAFRTYEKGKPAPTPEPTPEPLDKPTSPEPLGKPTSPT